MSSCNVLNLPPLDYCLAFYEDTSGGKKESAKTASGKMSFPTILSKIFAGSLETLILKNVKNFFPRQLIK